MADIDVQWGRVANKVRILVKELDRAGNIIGGHEKKNRDLSYALLQCGREKEKNEKKLSELLNTRQAVRDSLSSLSERLLELEELL